MRFSRTRLTDIVHRLACTATQRTFPDRRNTPSRVNHAPSWRLPHRLPGMPRSHLTTVGRRADLVPQHLHRQLGWPPLQVEPAAVTPRFHLLVVEAEEVETLSAPGEVGNAGLVRMQLQPEVGSTRS